MNATHYLENKILNAFRGITATAPTSLYAALFYNSPTNTGTVGVEVAYSGYQRQPVTFTAPAVNDSGKLEISNTEYLEWAETAEDLGRITHVGIYDSRPVGSGNMILWGELLKALTVYANEEPSFEPGALKYIESGGFSIDMKNKVLNFIRGSSITGFSCYTALFNGNPDDSYNPGIELAGASYSRVATAFGVPAIQPSGKTQIANTERLKFPSPTETWGLRTHDAIMDSMTAGNLVCAAPAKTERFIEPGHSIQIKPANWVISLD